MPEKGYTALTVSKQLYHHLREEARKENKKVATYASELMESMLFVEDKFRNAIPLLDLISISGDELIIRDYKKDKVVVVKAKGSDGGKVKFYCEADDNTDYCEHTAFAVAIPQVRKAIRR
jgi:hypothetical protein